MKILFFIFSSLFLLGSCVSKDAKDSGTPFTFNKPGGAPVVATTGASISLISPASSPGFISTPTVLVSGVVSGESVKLYTNATCTVLVGSSTATSTTAQITTSALATGIYNFYTKSTNAYTSSTCSAALLSYQYSGVAPTTASGMTLQSPSSSPSAVATPTILLTGVVSGETNYLYVDSACATSYGSAVASSSSVSITSVALAPGVHQFYTNSSNTAGTGTCSQALLSYEYIGILPTTATSLILASPTSSPNYDSTPTFLASGGVANGDTVKIYTDSGCTTLVGSAVATASSVEVTSSALSAGSYGFYSKSTNVIGTSACSGFLINYNYSGPAPVVTVSWTANREKAVNQAGGGYKVYYSKNSGFDISTASYVNVPYVSGPTAPVSKAFTDLLMGVTYFKVVAYSSLNAPGSTTGSVSTPSSQFSISLP